MRARAALAAALAGALLPLAAARALDVRRVEALGVVPAGAGAPGGATPRDAALDDALERAVLEVALDVHAASGPGARDPAVLVDREEALSEEALRALEERLAAALGSEPLDYALRFRILENRGRRPRLLLDDPDVEHEYIVLVEVFVDAERVHAQLAAAGLVAQAPPRELPVGRVRLVLEDVRSWPALEALRSAWVEHGAATEVAPRAFERGRVVLELATALEPPELRRALQEGVPPWIELRSVGAGPGSLRLRVVASEPPRGVEAAEAAEASRRPPPPAPR